MIYHRTTAATFTPALLDEARVRAADAIGRLSADPDLREVVIERQIRDSRHPEASPLAIAYEAILAREGHHLDQRSRRNAKGYEHSYVAMRSSRTVAG